MSQIYLGVQGSPSVPTQFTADDATIAIPLGNNLNVLSRDTSDNNDNGIQTTADPNGGQNLYIELTNRVTASVTTVDATPTVLLTFPLGSTPGTIIAWGDLTTYSSSLLSGSSYTFEGAAFTNGITATEIAVENKNIFEPAAMAAADFTLGVSGNNAVITVVGIVGQTINWSALFNYRFVG